MSRIIPILLFILISFSLKAQTDNEFWFSIPKETGSHGVISANNNVSFKINAGRTDAKVTLSMPANPLFIPREFVVNAGTSHIEVLAASWSEFESIYANPSTYGSATVSGKTNRGILIQSDNIITVYYDYNNDFNREIFSLKGNNALGTEFYTPFQNFWANGAGYIVQPFSTIEIVATEDNTVVDVNPTRAVQGFQFPGNISIVLNKGETFTLRANASTGPLHLSGTHIISNKKIAVSVNDDSVTGTGQSCKDIIGDQIVPIDIIGTKYLVLTGTLSNTHVSPLPKDSLRGEQIVVTATCPQTAITFKGLNGNVLYTCVLNAGQSNYFSPNITDNNQTTIEVESADNSKPFYVFHITGIGCEYGGAILPALAKCSGSDDLTIRPDVVYSSSNTKNAVLLSIPYDVSLPFNDASQPHNNFYYIIHFNQMV